MTKPEKKKSPGGVVKANFQPGDLVCRKPDAKHNDTYEVGSNPFTVERRTGHWVQDAYGQDHNIDNLVYVSMMPRGEYVLSPTQVQSIGGKEAIQKLSELATGGEVRSVSDTGGEKGTKAERFSLIPWKAVAVISRQFAAGAKKYADHNWRLGYEWSKSHDALQRHLTAWWEGEDDDPEFKLPHLGAVGFHVLVLITFAVVNPKRYARFDDRYKEPDDEE